MNPFEFVLANLVLMFVFSIIRHKLGIPVRSMRQMRGDDPPRTRSRPCACATRSPQLKERIKVLERITVEKENSLAKEIESLRDR